MVPKQMRSSEFAAVAWRKMPCWSEVRMGRLVGDWSHTHTHIKTIHLIT